MQNIGSIWWIMPEEEDNIITINEDFESDVDIQITGDDVKTILKDYKALREGVKKILEDKTSD